MTKFSRGRDPLAASRVPNWLLWMGVGLGVMCWFGHAWVGYALFGIEPFFSSVFPSDPVVFYTRSVGCSLVVGIAVVGNYALRLRVRLEEDARNLIEFSLQNHGDPAFLVRYDASICYVNNAACEALGYSPDELLGMLVTDIDPDIPKSVWSEHWLKMREAVAMTFESHHQTKSGHVFPVEISSVFFEYQSTEYVSAFARNITVRKNAEEKLRRSEEELRLITENVPALIAYLDMEQRYRFVNKHYATLCRSTPEELLGRTLADVLGAEAAALVEGHMERVLKGERQPLAYAMQTPEGERHFSTLRVPDFGPDGEVRGFFALATEVTEQKLIERRLLDSLEEKETLLKEIHHRVKNNLQLISSLLSLQMHHASSKPVRAMLQSIQNRIRSMGLVHEALYRASDLSKVDPGDYLGGLTDELATAFSRVGVCVHSEIHGHPLDIDTAGPCGLIVNELVTNSLQHAFPEGASGEVLVKFQDQEGGLRVLSVTDDGIGMRQSPSPDKSTLGLQLVQSLADQLGGTMEVHRDGGTMVRVSF